MDADYSFYVKSIATYNNSVLAIVHSFAFKGHLRPQGQHYEIGRWTFYEILRRHCQDVSQHPV